MKFGREKQTVLVYLRSKPENLQDLLRRDDRGTSVNATSFDFPFISFMPFSVLRNKKFACRLTTTFALSASTAESEGEFGQGGSTSRI